MTIEERAGGLEIKESELCDKTLKFLSAKLENEKDYEEFIAFATQFAKSLNEDISHLQGNEEIEPSTGQIYISPPSPKAYNKTSDDNGIFSPLKIRINTNS